MKVRSRATPDREPGPEHRHRQLAGNPKEAPGAHNVLWLLARWGAEVANITSIHITGDHPLKNK